MRIAYDKDALQVNGVLIVEEGPEYAAFFVPGRTAIIQAEVRGGRLNLFPERSGAHRALAAALKGDA